MAFTTITNQEIVGLGVTGLPDTPGLSTEAMQAEFDEYSIFLKDKFKTHIEEEEAETAAADIGATIPASLTNVTIKKIQPILNELASRTTTHIANTSNPHSVTKEQVGLGNVPNVATDDQTPTISEASTLGTFAENDTLKDIVGKTNKAIDVLGDHVADIDNPHSVTKAQVGLGNCDNTADADKPISTATQTALDAKAPTNHATTATTYGGGNASNYGHVKLDDSYITSGGAASDSVGASSKALSDAYTALHAVDEGKAPTDHASANTTYGIGTSTKYGHTMLTDAYNPTTASDADDGVAVSQKGVKDAVTYLLGQISTAGGGDMMRSVYDPDGDGVIAVPQGGTGNATNTSNSVLVGNGTSAVKNISSAKGAFHSTGSGNEPGFGTLPVDEGGTGLTSSPSMLVNLGSTTADNVMKASPRPGVNGTLPVANGGTGNATNTANSVLVGDGTNAVKNIASASGAFYSTGANNAPQFGTLPVAQGGTGQTTFTSGRALIGNGTSGISEKAIDTVPTASSTNLITSGAVESAMANSVAPDYQSNVAYDAGDIVTYTDGKTYKCIQDTTAGTAPTNTSYWSQKTLGEQVTALNSALKNSIVYLGTESVTLVTANGTQTVAQILTNALNAMKNLNPSNLKADATHMKFSSITVPYGNGTESRENLQPTNNLHIVSSYSTISGLTATRTEVISSDNSLYLFSAQLSSSPLYSSARINSSNNVFFSNYLNNKPANGTTLTCVVELYKKL